MRTSPTVVVTGATSGIGLALAEALAARVGTLVLVGRDAARLDAALMRVRARAAPSAQLVAMRADLSSVSATRALAARIRAELPQLHVLIHNAGIWPMKRALTAEGFEEAFAVNHLAPSVLNAALRDLLVASAPSRVVQVTAGLYVKGRVDLNGDARGARFGKLHTYPTTKLWNLLATLALSRSLEGSGVTVNAVHPGVVRTGLGDARGLLGWAMRRVKRRWLSPAQGALGPLRLAVAPELDGVTGRYFDQLAEVPLHPSARVPGLADAVAARTRALLERP